MANLSHSNISSSDDGENNTHLHRNGKDESHHDQAGLSHSNISSSDEGENHTHQGRNGKDKSHNGQDRGSTSDELESVAEESAAEKWNPPKGPAAMMSNAHTQNQRQRASLPGAGPTPQSSYINNFSSQYSGPGAGYGYAGYGYNTNGLINPPIHPGAGINNAVALENLTNIMTSINALWASVAAQDIVIENLKADKSHQAKEIQDLHTDRIAISRKILNLEEEVSRLGKMNGSQAGRPMRQVLRQNNPQQNKTKPYNPAWTGQAQVHSTGEYNSDSWRAHGRVRNNFPGPTNFQQNTWNARDRNLKATMPPFPEPPQSPDSSKNTPQRSFNPWKMTGTVTMPSVKNGKPGTGNNGVSQGNLSPQAQPFAPVIKTPITKTANGTSPANNLPVMPDAGKAHIKQGVSKMSEDYDALMKLEMGTSRK